jgi:hypothetical protein
MFPREWLNPVLVDGVIVAITRGDDEGGMLAGVGVTWLGLFVMGGVPC